MEKIHYQLDIVEKGSKPNQILADLCNFSRIHTTIDQGQDGSGLAFWNLAW